MKILHIYYSDQFKKSVNKFIPKEKDLFARKLKLFREDPFSPQLKTHKLKGKLKNYWSFSLTYNLRVLFRFESTDSVEFIDAGTHEIYK